jgi:enhancer of polycomb-like protein
MQDPEEPVMLFTGPLNRDKMEIAGIRPPPDPPIGSSSATKPPFRCQGRIGRGGRIIFDRWNLLLQVPIGQQASHFLK